MTALHYAVEEGSEELLAMLLEAGANPTLGNNSIGLDNTPFHHAISRGRYGMAKMLLDTGKFDVNQPGDPFPCFEHAHLYTPTFTSLEVLTGIAENTTKKSPQSP